MPSRRPLAITTSMPSPATRDEMRLLVVMPPRPREERAVSIYCERSRPGATRRMTCDAGSAGDTVVDAVDVAQDDERLGVHHRRHEAREFVVVGEHQFGDRDRVVLVDDRDDARREHRLHAVALVEVLAPRGEALLGGEHLPADDAVFVEEVVVAVQQLHLSDGREELARRNGVDASDPGFEDAAARGHGPRRDEDHLDARAVEPCDLVHERRDARGVGPSVFAGQHVAADLDDDAAVFFRFTIHTFTIQNCFVRTNWFGCVRQAPPLPSLRGA